MKKEKFGNIFQFLPKSKIKAGEGKEEGKYPLFTSSPILSKYYDNYLYEGESLVFGTGGQPSLHYINDKFATSTDCFVVQKNLDYKEKVDVKYVSYFLKSNKSILEDGFKGAGLKHISKKYLSNIKIPFPETLDEQIKIANLLTQVETLIAKREESISLLDKLLKSTFLDMFGDPVLNPKGWDTLTIEELVKKEKYSIKRGPFGGALKKEIFVPEGYLVYEQYHALNNDFSMARYFITEEKFQELKAFEVKEGDIIISCSGVYLGKLAIVPKNAKKGIINQALLKITLDENKMNNFVFTYIFRNDNFIHKFFGANRGAGIPNFPPMKEFKKFKFIKPPKPLQDKFATIVQQVEETKKYYQKSLDELNQLFGSLSQRAFKGELDLSKMELSKLDEPDDSSNKLEATITKEQIETFRNSTKSVLESLKIDELKAIAKQVETICKLPTVGDAVKRASILSQSFKSFNIPTLNIEIPKFYKSITSFDFNSISTFNTFQQTIQKLRERVEHIYQMLEDIPQIKEAMESGVLSRDDFLELPLRNDYEYSQIKRVIMNKISSGELSQHFDESSEKIKLVKPE